MLTCFYSFSDVSFQNLSTNDVAENFFKPLAGKRLVITDVIIQADRNVTTQALIDIFEANAIDSTTVDKQLFQFDLPKQESLVLTGLNIITTEGVFINGKTDDNNVLLSIGGYFVDA